MRCAMVGAVLVAAVACDSAQAAKISKVNSSSGPELVVESPGNAAENVVAGVESGNVVFRRRQDGAPLEVGSGCYTNPAPDVVTCSQAADVKRVRFDGGVGDDRLDFVGLPYPILGNAGAGDDAVWLGTKPSNVEGADGNDYIYAGRGGGVLNAGDGRDRIEIAFVTHGDDDVRGGDGDDLVSYYSYPAAVTLTFDDNPGDGAAGQRANVHSDIERVIATRFDDRLVGGAADNDFHAGTGNDTIIGGGGTDSGNGNGGNDVIDLADDVADKADCGDGDDEVIVDAVDVATACEKSTLRATDADRDGEYRPLDCNDGDPAVHHGAADVPGNGADEDCSGADAPLADSDHDGVLDAQDCDDASAAVHQGAADVPMDGVDQDCSGADALYPLLEADINLTVQYGRRTRILAIDVSPIPAAARVEVRCRGRGCPARKVYRPRRGRVRVRHFRRALSPGTVVEVRVSAPSALGKVKRVTIRRKRRPKVERLCLAPLARHATRC